MHKDTFSQPDSILGKICHTLQKELDKEEDDDNENILMKAEVWNVIYSLRMLFL